MNMGWCDVTLVAGVGTGTWKHPDQTKVGNTNADVIELDDTPPFVFPVCTAHPTDLGVGIVRAVATKNGVRIDSTHNSDDSTYRVVAFVKIPSLLYLGQR